MTQAEPADPGIEFSFYISCDLNTQVQLCIHKLLGCIPAYRDVELAPNGSVRPSALHIVAQLSDGGDVLAVPTRTRYAEADFAGASWDTWLTFPVKYRDLGPTAQVAVTVWETREGGDGAQPLGGATLAVFSKKGRMKTGAHALQLWDGVQADPRHPTATPGKVPVAQRGEAGRVERALKRYQRGELERVPWLDRLAVTAAGEVLAREAAPTNAQPNPLRLHVELPSFPLPVLYQQATLSIGTVTAPAGAAAAASTGAAISIATPLPGTAGSGVAPAAASAPLAARPGAILQLIDPEVGRDSPAEMKAQKLARSAGRALVDGGLRPNTAERARIDAVLASPPGRPLSRDDRELLWRFRFALTSDGRALTRFLRCVDWSDALEAAQGRELMERWAPISVADALELLSPDFPIEAVRKHAVAALHGPRDEELLGYLLQLVQALRYEPSHESGLAEFLLRRARVSAAVASALFWYLCAELDDPTFGERAAHVQQGLLRPTSARTAGGQSSAAASGLQDGAVVSLGGAGGLGLEDCISYQVKLVARLRHLADAVRQAGRADRKTEMLRSLMRPGEACEDLTTFACPCPLDPAVRLLGIVPQDCSVFKSKVSPLKITFRAELPSGMGSDAAPVGSSPLAASTPGDGEGSSASDTFTSRMASLTLPSQLTSGSQAREALADSSDGPGTAPASPQQGSWLTSGGTSTPPPSTATVTLIYKRGDDLRQDQLVLQMISLMDRLLKREHMDLRITAYQVLPTSCYDGLIEFVPSAEPLSQVASIQHFLTKYHPDQQAPFGISPAVLSNYIRSCAGCTVLTYILGVGDRHMDNIMLTHDGRLFHIDFGFFLGRDPKFTTAPLVLTRAMVDAMGGPDGPHYRQFLQLCCEAYNILRKSANLLLSLLHLMAGSSIPDIRADPEKALLKVQERLRPELTDEEAAAEMERLLREAPAAILARIYEVQHRAAQAVWR